MGAASNPGTHRGPQGPEAGTGRARSAPSAIARHNELEAALVSFIRMLLHGVSQTEVFHQLCQSAMRALHIDDVGISLADPDGVLSVGETASDLARIAEEHQALLQEGPCREAFDHTRVVIADDDELLRKWPRFGPFVREHGIHGVAAFPLHVGSQRIGVLDCYWSDPAQRLAYDDVLVASAIADAATVYVLHARRAAATVGAYTAQLEAANVELHRSRTLAIRANEAKNEFLSRTSHELRTPLNAILGFAQILEYEHGDDPDSSEPIEHILRAGRHLLSLVDDVIDVARVESGEVHLDTEALSVGELLDESVRLVGPLAAVRTIDLTMADCAQIPEVDADHRRALQVMLNLLSNATKYNHDGGHIDIECTTVADRVRISVTDTGPGIDPEDITKLFVPFERLGAERTEIEGTGIGLALSKALTEAMGGTLDVASTPGSGSTFSVELPRHTCSPPPRRRYVP
jgi:signal transduction histidine kinase